ncbi:MAG: GNAT family N-acetyltransferase [Bdellovibrionales bacterium]|nr:GNAT family N-acetyltransferase [Bdellovibrionales bacterium]
MNSWPILFDSDAWTTRVRQLGWSCSEIVTTSHRSLRVARIARDYLVDYESWKDLNSSPPVSADVWVSAKLLPALRPVHLPRGTVVVPYGVSPYVVLQAPRKPDAEAMSHIRRCERKVTRDFGRALELRVLDEKAAPGEAEAWFEGWWTHLVARRAYLQGSLDESWLRRRGVFRDWILGAPRPAWMKLFELRVEDTTFCRGLFYVWEGVFYYYAPALNFAAQLRAYGAGKIFVQRLLDWSRDQGLEVFDFLQGEERYKFDWNPELRPLVRACRPLTWRGHAYCTALEWRESLRGVLRAGKGR